MSQVNGLETIKIYVDCQSEHLGKFLDKIKAKIGETKSNKTISIVDQA